MAWRASWPVFRECPSSPSSGKQAWRVHYLPVSPSDSSVRCCARSASTIPGPAHPLGAKGGGGSDPYILTLRHSVDSLGRQVVLVASVHNATNSKVCRAPRFLLLPDPLLALPRSPRSLTSSLSSGLPYSWFSLQIEGLELELMLRQPGGEVELLEQAGPTGSSASGTGFGLSPDLGRTVDIAEAIAPGATVLCRWTLRCALLLRACLVLWGWGPFHP